MFQRRQTLYFSLALILAAIPLFGLELFSFQLDKGQVVVDAYSYSIPESKQFIEKNDIWILSIIQVVFALWIIFSFKWRARQIFIGWMLLLLNIFTTAWVFLGAYVQANSCTACKVKPDLHFSNLLFVSALAFIFVFLGIMGVRKDKKLIESIDRIR